MVSLQAVSPHGSFVWDEKTQRLIYVPRSVGQRVNYLDDNKKQKVAKVLWFTAEKALLLPIQSPESEIDFKAKTVIVPLRQLLGDAKQDLTKISQLVDTILKQVPRTDLDGFGDVNMLEIFRNLVKTKPKSINQTQYQFELTLALDAVYQVESEIKKRFKIPDERDKPIQFKQATDRMKALTARIIAVVVDSTPYNRMNVIDYGLIFRLIIGSASSTRLGDKIKQVFDQLPILGVDVAKETLNNILDGTTFSSNPS